MNKKRIMIVEDEAITALALKDQLERKGYEVVGVKACYTGEQAIKNAGKYKPDLILMDIVLRGKIDGIEAAKKIFSKYTIPIIFVTARSDIDTINKAKFSEPFGYIIKPTENGDLLGGIEIALHKHKVETDLKKKDKRLEKDINIDPLTKCLNRRALEKILNSEIDRAKRYDRNLALIFLDIDNFKKFNDSYGHVEGDAVLVKLGKLLRQHFRESDSVIRFGGEEFLVILPETTSANAVIGAEKLRKLFAKIKFKPKKANKSINLTVSVGVAEYRKSQDINEFIAQSDKAMYEAKKRGKNLVYCFKDEK